MYPLESQGSFWIRDFFTSFFLLQQGAAAAAVRERERERKPSVGVGSWQIICLRELDRTSQREVTACVLPKSASALTIYGEDLGKHSTCFLLQGRVGGTLTLPHAMKPWARVGSRA